MDIKELIENCIKQHIAPGYKYVIEAEASQEVIDAIKEDFHLSEIPEGMTEDEVFKSIGGFCSYKEETKMEKYAEDCVHIFVDGIRRVVEKFASMGNDDMSFEELVEFSVLHECRHSQQILAIREAHMNPDDIFRIESEKYPYGQGPMETDANQYAMEYMIDPNMKQRPYEGKALDVMWKENEKELNELLAAN